MIKLVYRARGMFEKVKIMLHKVYKVKEEIQRKEKKIIEPKL
jgi:hypothetical protein